MHKITKRKDAQSQQCIISIYSYQQNPNQTKKKETKSYHQKKDRQLANKYFPMSQHCMRMTHTKIDEHHKESHPAYTYTVPVIQC